MKKLSILTFLLLSIGQLKAQISLSASDIAKVGDTIFQFIDTTGFSGIEPGVGGANIIWDLSNLSNDVSDTILVVHPDSTPHNSSKTSADRCNYSVSENLLAYLKPNGDGLYLHGLGIVSPSDTSKFYNLALSTPPLFSIAFGNSYGLDTMLSSTSSFVGAYYDSTPQQVPNPWVVIDSIKGASVINHFDTVDGYGVVITPNGAFETLRRKSFEARQDSLWGRLRVGPPVDTMFWQFIGVELDTNIFYQWWTKDKGIHVAEIVENENGFTQRTSYQVTTTPAVARFTTTKPGALDYTFTDTSFNTPTSWVWDFGDGDTSHSKNTSHSYATAGSYEVCLTATNADGSGTWCDSMHTEDAAISVKETNIQFDIYPNPAEDYIYFNSNISGLQIRILDMMGNEVKSEILPASNSVIRTSDLSTGIYLLQVADLVNNSERTIKLVITD